MNTIPMIQNAERALRVHVGDNILGDTKDVFSTYIDDLLTDLMHLCEDRQIDFLERLEIAKRHYIEERAE